MANQCTTDAKMFCQAWTTPQFDAPQLANVSHLGFCQLCSGMLFPFRVVFGMQTPPAFVATWVTLRMRMVAVSLLCKHIAQIVAVCAKPEMVRITAQWYVAGMATNDSWQDHSIGQLESDAMCWHFASTPYGTYAIAFLITLALPEPAAVSLEYIRPEAVGKRLHLALAIAGP
jgi:hypothetical protein